MTLLENAIAKALKAHAVSITPIADQKELCVVIVDESISDEWNYRQICVQSRANKIAFYSFGVEQREHERFCPRLAKLWEKHFGGKK